MESKLRSRSPFFTALFFFIAFLFSASVPHQMKTEKLVIHRTVSAIVSSGTQTLLVPGGAILRLDQKADAEILNAMLKSSGFRGSLLQRVVGSAEGTRLPDGQTTWAYGGHVDPGNFVRNTGTYSLQPGIDKPVFRTAIEADKIQSQILRLQALELLYQAKLRGLTLNLFQLANGIDLANQSPECACVQQPDKNIVDKLAAGIDPFESNTRKFTKMFAQHACSWGYIDRLAQALNKKGLVGLNAVVEARKWTFFETNPNSARFNSWNAAGFNHDPDVIEADQFRRAQAVAMALRFHVEHPRLFRP